MHFGTAGTAVSRGCTDMVGVHGCIETSCCHHWRCLTWFAEKDEQTGPQFLADAIPKDIRYWLQEISLTQGSPAQPLCSFPLRKGMLQISCTSQQSMRRVAMAASPQVSPHGLRLAPLQNLDHSFLLGVRAAHYTICSGSHDGGL